MYDIIPDIHGQIEKLEHVLGALGYRQRKGAWRHSDPNRSCVFLGDFIDRGRHNGSVIALVRAMQQAGSAQAIMGNHELNAIHYHTQHPETGAPLREWSPKNRGQHKRFLDEFPPNTPAAAEAIDWMRQLPLYLELDGFRAVHACWDEGHIAELEQQTQAGVLDFEQLVRAADRQDPLFAPVSRVTTGPEVALPAGGYFIDGDGNRRSVIRAKWWLGKGRRSWSDVALSLPENAALPAGDIPPELQIPTYPETAKPVFFGHYAMKGKPVLQAPNTLCLDYYAGRDGPLVSYYMEKGAPLSAANIRVFQP